MTSVVVDTFALVSATIKSFVVTHAAFGSRFIQSFIGIGIRLERAQLFKRHTESSMFDFDAKIAKY